MVLQFGKIIEQIFSNIQPTPENIRTFITFMGRDQSLIASILIGSTDIPLLDII